MKDNTNAMTQKEARLARQAELLKFDLERDDLAERFGGGIPKGTLCVVSGDPGAGKSILIQRLVAGFLAHGQTVSYVSSELTTNGLLAQMRSLNYDLRRDILQQQLVFVPAHPVVGARAPRDELLERIAKARLLYTKDIIIFDTFSKFIAEHIKQAGDSLQASEQIEGVLHLFKRLNASGKTIILTRETGQVDDRVFGGFVESADTLIDVDSKVRGSTVARRMHIKRMARAAGRFAEVIAFRVEPGVGIVIEIRSVV